MPFAVKRGLNGYSGLSDLLKIQVVKGDSHITIDCVQKNGVEKFVRRAQQAIDGTIPGPIRMGTESVETNNTPPSDPTEKLVSFVEAGEEGGRSTISEPDGAPRAEYSPENGDAVSREPESGDSSDWVYYCCPSKLRRGSRRC